MMELKILVFLKLNCKLYQYKMHVLAFGPTSFIGLSNIVFINPIKINIVIK